MRKQTKIQQVRIIWRLATTCSNQMICSVLRSVAILRLLRDCGALPLRAVRSGTISELRLGRSSVGRGCGARLCQSLLGIEALEVRSGITLSESLSDLSSAKTGFIDYWHGPGTWSDHMPIRNVPECAPANHLSGLRKCGILRYVCLKRILSAVLEMEEAKKRQEANVNG